jgi:hypothetical protein
MKSDLHVLREESGRTYCIEYSAKDVHDAVEENPAETHAIFKTLVTIDEETMDDRNNARETKTDEHHCTIRTPCWGPEALNP